jgi:hypothetical protein
VATAVAYPSDSKQPARSFSDIWRAARVLEDRITLTYRVKRITSSTTPPQKKFLEIFTDEL